MTKPPKVRRYTLKAPLTEHSHYTQLGPVVLCPSCKHPMQLAYRYGDGPPEEKADRTPDNPDTTGKVLP